jgi:hypothetical protein
MNALDAALYSRLSGTSAITSLLASVTSIYAGQAPEGSAYPYIVFNVQGGGDENQTPHRTKNLVLFIRVYSDVSKKIAGDVDAAIDTALHLSPLSGVTGYTNTWFAREQDLETVENPPTGNKIFMQGGLYRSRLAQ